MDNGASIENYKVHVRRPGVIGSDFEVETGSSECDFVCWNLRPGTAYLFRVCAFNDTGWGEWVNLPAYGLTIAAPPSQPADFRKAHAYPLPGPAPCARRAPCRARASGCPSPTCYAP